MSRDSVQPPRQPLRAARPDFAGHEGYLAAGSDCIHQPEAKYFSV